MVAVAIAKERTPAELRALARRERDGRVSARLLALANALDGMSRGEAARAAGMDRQTLRDWVHRYNAEGIEGLRDRPRPGRPCALDEGRQAALKGLILRGPRLERDGCVAWRARDLRELVERRFGVRYSESGVRRLLRGPDLSWQKTRPVHPEADPKAQERFKKPCPAGGGRPAPRGRPRRAVVHGRGAGRPEGPPHPRLVPEGGAPARRAPAGVQPRLPVRRRVPGARRGGRAGPARGLDRGHGRLPRRAVARRAGRDARRARPGRGRLARERGAERAGEPDLDPPAPLQPRVEPGRAGVGVPARPLAQPPGARRRLPRPGAA